MLALARRAIVELDPEAAALEHRDAPDHVAGQSAQTCPMEYARKERTGAGHGRSALGRIRGKAEVRDHLGDVDVLGGGPSPYEQEQECSGDGPWHEYAVLSSCHVFHWAGIAQGTPAAGFLRLLFEVIRGEGEVSRADFAGSSTALDAAGPFARRVRSAEPPSRPADSLLDTTVGGEAPF